MTFNNNLLDTDPDPDPDPEPEPEPDPDPCPSPEPYGSSPKIQNDLIRTTQFIIVK